MRRLSLGRVLERHVVNRPLLITPRRAEALMGIVSRELSYSGHLVRSAAVEEAEGEGGSRILLADLAASSPRMAGPRDDRKVFRLIDGVAVIPVEGDLVHKLGDLDPWCGMTGYDGIAYKLAEAAADPDVSGIMLDIDSPGGMVDGCAACGDVIARARAVKPVWASLSDSAYSAACWLASQCDRILIPRTGGIGSVGVVTLHADFSRHLDADGITVTVIHAGAHKADGNSYAPLPAGVLADITAELEALRLAFAQAVAMGRGARCPVDAVMATEARCFLAEDAIRLGLVDAVANPDDALAEFIGVCAQAPRTLSIPAAQAAHHRPNPAAQAAIKTEGDPMAQATTEPASKDTEKDQPAAAEGAAPVCDTCPHKDKARTGPPCRDCPDNPEDGATEDPPAAQGGEAAAQAATARVQAILTAPQAKGRDALAQHLAFNTDMPAKDAVAAMAAAPAGASSQGAAFAAAMAAHAGPHLGGDAGQEKSAGNKLKAAREYRDQQANAR